GVHLGHRALVDRTRALAAAHEAEAAVLTFDPHPVRVLAPDKAPPLITTDDDKALLLADAGVEVLLAQRFDRAFAALTPIEFVDAVLVAGLRARAVIVGYDFRFGARRAGDLDTLRALGAERGFAVEVISAQTGRGDEIASSSRVRAYVGAGEMEAAEALLGRPFHVTGTIVHGHRRGHALGFPTANIEAETELAPAVGIYAGWLDWGEGRRPAVVSVGHNPTFGAGAPRTIEAHVIDATGLDLYERRCRLWLARRQRDEETFAGLEALKAAIGRDRDLARAWLAERAPPTLP
ncbi:MAG: riboflavin biosynthesis protein RibF, partial [bacterium]